MNYTRYSCRTLFLLATSLVAAISVSIVPSLAAAEPSEKEIALLAILRSEDSPASEKAITCKHLAVHGSSESVAELAKLLGDDRLASWARIPLEAIPGPEADAALRAATEKLDGNLLIGTINSIGVRRDAQAVDLLTTRLQDTNADVAAAAAVALGRIGNVAASKSLRPLLASAAMPVRNAVAEGAVLCAEHLLAAGDQATSIAIYDEVRAATVPKQRIVEATRGAILSRKPDAGIALLLEQFKSSDQSLFQIGLSTAREFPGNAVDKALAAELARIPSERAPLLIQAMADRKDTVVLGAILEAAGSGPRHVRLAALNAIGRVGDATCVSPLIQIAAESDQEVVQAAKSALGGLPGDAVDKVIVARLPKAEPKLYPVLLELVGQRQIQAVPELLKALGHKDKSIRALALTSLGATVSPKDLGALISQVVSPKYPEDADAAQVALRTACVRMPDRDACSQELATAMDRAPAATKIVLLNIIGAVGGTKSLQIVGTAAKSKDADLQDAGSKLLGGWMTLDAAPVLLDLTKTQPEGKFQERAFKGYIRIARQFKMPEPERLEMFQNALAACRKIAEQKSVVDVLKIHPNFDTFKLALKVAQETPDLKDDATQVALVIAQKLGDKGPQVAELLAGAGLGKVKLEIVKAEYGNGDSQKDVTEILQKQATDLQLISLPASNYNEIFGGDPAPGKVKQLKIIYRINDKDGNVMLAENALIILPMPK